MQLRGGIRSVSYYEWSVSAPIQKHCNSYSPSNAGLNEPTNAKIDFPDGYKVTTNALCKLPMVW